MAVSNAKSASTDYAPSHTTLLSLSDSLEVARIQMEIMAALKGLDGYDSAIEDLDSRLCDVNEARLSIFTC